MPPLLKHTLLIYGGHRKGAVITVVLLITLGNSALYFCINLNLLLLGFLLLFVPDAKKEVIGLRNAILALLQKVNQ